MPRKITDTLQSFTIGQVAELWSKETGEQADLIERKLIQAIHKASNDPNSHDVDFKIATEFLHERYDSLSAAERDDRKRNFEKEQYAKIDGLHVDHRGEKITSETTVRCTAIEAWCEREDFELPEFLMPKKEELQSRVRGWLRLRIEAVNRGDEERKTKDDYRASAISEFGPKLSKRAFDRIWDNMVPHDWKRGGRPKKPSHS